MTLTTAPRAKALGGAGGVRGKGGSAVGAASMSLAPMAGAAGRGAKALAAIMDEDGPVALITGADGGLTANEAGVDFGIVAAFVDHGGAHEAITGLLVGAAALG